MSGQAKPATDAPGHPAAMVVARRLDTLQSGSGQYLEQYLQLCSEAGLATTLVFAPRRSFGNLAWARIDPRFLRHVAHVDWAQTARIGSYYVSTAPSVWMRFIGRIGSELLRRLRRGADQAYPSLLGYELDTAEASQVKARLKRHRVDTLTVEYSSLAPLLSHVDSNTQRIVFLHDLFSLRAESFVSRGLAPDHAVMSLEEEAKRCEAADLLIHASCVEEKRLREIMPDRRHIWCRPSVRPGTQQDWPERAPHAVFIGSVHAGNTTALSFIRQKIWPRVREKCPDSMLHVVGSIAATIDPSDAAKEGLRLIGPVEDLSALGGADAIGLAPIQFGSGIPIKVVDYLAIGMPVVVTAGAVAAFGDALDGLVSEAEDDKAFAGKVIDLLNDTTRRQQMSLQSKGAIERLQNDDLLAELKVQPPAN